MIKNFLGVASEAQRWLQTSLKVWVNRYDVKEAFYVVKQWSPKQEKLNQVITNHLHINLHVHAVS